MSKTPISKKETPPSESPVVLLLGTLGDVTWRMFVPTVGLALIGAYFDTKLATAPIYTAVGGLVGFVVAFYLIYRQLKKDF